MKSKFIRSPDQPLLQKTEGKIQFSMIGEFSEKYQPGTAVAVRAKVKRPTSYEAEGVFNYPKILAQQDIWVSGFIRSALFIKRVKTRQTILHRIIYLAENIRQEVGEYLDRTSSSSGLYRAILIGDRSQIPEQTLEAFKACGIMHILAVSGIHMAIVTTFVYNFILFFLRRSTRLMLLCDIRKITALLSMGPLFFYCLLTGSNTPVLRSLLMSLLILLAFCVNRRKSTLALLSFAAFFILTVSPQQLFTPSFQLSFAAISAILLLVPTIQKLFKTQSGQTNISRKIKAGIYSSLLVSIVASLATLPLLLFYFNRFSLISPLSNIIVEPLVCMWSLPLGILALPFIKIFPSLAELLISCGSMGLQLTEYLSLKTAQLPYIQIWNITPSFFLISLYYTGLLALLYSSNKATKTVSFIITGCCIIFFIQQPPELFSKKKNQITIIDVGQGSSVLVEFENGQTILADCGGSSFSSNTVGEKVVAPLLYRRGIKKINTIYISHSDSDHYNGVPAIIKHFDIEQIFIASRTSGDQQFNKLINQLESAGIRINIMKSGELHHYGKNKICCIRNFSEDKPPKNPIEENRGIVLKVILGNFSILLPGDIDRAAELQILQEDLESDLLLASHHGSRTSNSEDFLQTVSPDFLLVSAGVSKKKHFPHPLVTKRAEQLEIPTLSTAKNGTLDIIIENGTYKIIGKQKRNNNPLQKAENVCLSCMTQKDQSSRANSR